MWRARGAKNVTGRSRAQPLGAIYRQTVVMNLLNPKVALFFLAFLPQFVSTQGDLSTQLALTAIIFLAVVGIGDSVWAVFAGLLRPAMLRFSRLRNRLTGGFFIAAGVGLACAKQD